MFRLYTDGDIRNMVAVNLSVTTMSDKNDALTLIDIT